MNQATAYANTNIALIKYWGKSNKSLNIPAVSSLSMTIDGLGTTTTVVPWHVDELLINNKIANGAEKSRLINFLNDFRKAYGLKCSIKVISKNSVPYACGLASSASAFASLSAALNEAFSLHLSNKELSILARKGSASAARSVFSPMAVLHGGPSISNEQSFAQEVSEAKHLDLRMIVALVNKEQKSISSRDAMNITKNTSPFFDTFVRNQPNDIERAIRAIYEKDFITLGKLMEHSTQKMHACMWSSIPHINYLRPKTLEIINSVFNLRKEHGPIAYYTTDAGPNVKILSQKKHEHIVIDMLKKYIGTSNIYSCSFGEKPQILSHHLS